MGKLISKSIKKKLIDAPSKEELINNPSQYSLQLYIDEMEAVLKDCIEAYIQISFQVEHILRNVSQDVFRAQEVSFTRKQFLKSWNKSHRDFQEEFKESLEEIRILRNDNQNTATLLLSLALEVTQYFSTQATFIADSIIETNLK